MAELENNQTFCFRKLGKIIVFYLKNKNLKNIGKRKKKTCVMSVCLHRINAC